MIGRPFTSASPPGSFWGFLQVGGLSLTLIPSLFDKGEEFCFFLLHDPTLWEHVGVTGSLLFVLIPIFIKVARV